MSKINFSLVNDSFKEGSNSYEDICKNIEELFKVVNRISDAEDDIYKDNDLFSVEFLNKKTLGELLWAPNEEFKHDHKQMLMDITTKTKNTIPAASQQIGLNNIPTPNIIYILMELNNFYKKYIENIEDKDEFVKRIDFFFKEINFSDNVRVSLNSLEGKLKDFNKIIVDSLECLENEFEQCMIDSSYETITALKMFSTKLGLETTNEGKASRKSDFEFSFIDDDKETLKICCEPHIKMEKSKNAGDTKWYPNRLHFHARHPSFGEKVLVGHIGGHL